MERDTALRQSRKMSTDVVPSTNGAGLTIVISILPDLDPTKIFACSFWRSPLGLPFVTAVANCSFIFPLLVWKLAWGKSEFPFFLSFFDLLFPCRVRIVGPSPIAGVHGSM